MKIISIDPSVNTVGWALIDGLYRVDDVIKDDKADWKWGMWKLASMSYTFRLREVVEWMILECDGLDPDEDWLVIEWPAYFDSMAGHIAAKAGHTINLAGMAGYIAGFFRLPWQNIHFVTATKWKGSVSKEITRRRFFKHMGVKQIYTIDHNAVDAVMLLLEFCKRKQLTFKIVAKTMEHFESQPD